MPFPLAIPLVVAVSGALLLGGCTMSDNKTDTSSGPSTSGSSLALVAVWHSTQRGEPQIALYSNGTLAGNDGCNPFRGTYTQNGNDIVFEITFQTMRACLNIDTWLSNARTATITDTGLQVFNAEGATIGTLVQKEQSGQVRGHQGRTGNPTLR